MIWKSSLELLSSGSLIGQHTSFELNHLKCICANISSFSKVLHSIREIPISVESQDPAKNKSWTGRRTTLQEDEVNKFRSKAKCWWDTRGEFKPLHSFNKLRIPLVRDGIIQSGIASPDHISDPRPLQGLRLLDVGCGGGLLSEPLARLGAKVTGLDPAQESISVATQHAQSDESIAQNVRYICGTIEEHARDATELYDGVIASEVLEHVASVELFVQTCVDVLKPGGSFFITTENRTIRSWLAAIVVAEYVLGLLPKGTHDWNKFVPPQDLRALLEKYGCSTRLMHGMAYLPFWNEWFWVTDSSVNYALHAVKRL